MKSHLADFVALVGFALITVGAWIIYHPAGFIVGGLMLLAGASGLARLEAKRSGK